MALAVAVGRVCSANWHAVDYTLYFLGLFPLFLAGAFAPYGKSFSHLLLHFAVLCSRKPDVFTLSDLKNLICNC